MPTNWVTGIESIKTNSKWNIKDAKLVNSSLSAGYIKIKDINRLNYL